MKRPPTRPVSRRLAGAGLLATALAAATLAAEPAPLRGAKGETSKVLVVLAHPDDELHMAGTLAQLADSGAEVKAVYLTSGDAGKDRSGRGLSGAALAAVREREARWANRALGFVHPPAFLSFPDGELWTKLDEVDDALSELANAFAPDLLLTLGPNGVTGHPDHRAAFVVTLGMRDRVGYPPGFLAVVYSHTRVGNFDPRWDFRGVHEGQVDARVCLDAEDSQARLTLLRLYRTQFRPEQVQLFAEKVLAVDRVEEFQGDGVLPGAHVLRYDEECER